MKIFYSYTIVLAFLVNTLSMFGMGEEKVELKKDRFKCFQACQRNYRFWSSGWRITKKH